MTKIKANFQIQKTSEQYFTNKIYVNMRIHIYLNIFKIYLSLSFKNIICIKIYAILSITKQIFHRSFYFKMIFLDLELYFKG